jgi:hypothetical protein
MDGDRGTISSTTTRRPMSSLAGGPRRGATAELKPAEARKRALSCEAMRMAGSHTMSRLRKCHI